MAQETWLDGFNFFYQWESTRGLFGQSGHDIVKTLERSLRILSRHLGPETKSVVVFLDGGLSRSQTRIGGLRVRYCGPGKKADDRMAEDLLDLGDGARDITAVSNDRELKARLRNFGASCLGVGEFLAMTDKKKERRAQGGRGGRGVKGGKSGMDGAEILREKCRSLSPAEVQAWLEYFGGED